MVCNAYPAKLRHATRLGYSPILGQFALCRFQSTLGRGTCHSYTPATTGNIRRNRNVVSASDHGPVAICQRYSADSFKNCVDPCNSSIFISG